MNEISGERMREIIAQAKDAGIIRDFTPCGMGLSPRIGFSSEVYKATLDTLVELELKKSQAQSQGASPSA